MNCCPNKSRMQIYPTYMYGHKKRLLGGIFSMVPPCRSFGEVFGGTGVVSAYAKRLGMKISINDNLQFLHLQHKALIVNDGVVLDESDLKLLTAPTRVAAPWIERFYLGTFGQRNARFLDRWAANIYKLEDPIKREIAIWLAILCAQRRIKYYAARVSPGGIVSGSQKLCVCDLSSDILMFVRHYLPRIIIGNNGLIHEAYNQDAVTLISRIGVDVCYIDSPYCCRGGEYEKDLAFYEHLLRILSGHGTDVRHPWSPKADLSPYTDFSEPSKAMGGYATIFAQSTHIPVLIVSYNTSSGITPEQIQTLAEANDRRMTARQAYVYPLPTNSKKPDRTSSEVLMKFE